ncbi:hypothetical protein A2U01_0113100, partial [Trifolium medium]|nr:hypothetical protein [Trifolium medium]
RDSVAERARRQFSLFLASDPELSAFGRWLLAERGLARGLI